MSEFFKNSNFHIPSNILVSENLHYNGVLLFKMAYLVKNPQVKDFKVYDYAGKTTCFSVIWDKNLNDNDRLQAKEGNYQNLYAFFLREESKLTLTTRMDVNSILR